MEILNALRTIEKIIQKESDRAILWSVIKSLKKAITKYESVDDFLKTLEESDPIFEDFEDTYYDKNSIYEASMIKLVCKYIKKYAKQIMDEYSLIILIEDYDKNPRKWGLIIFNSVTNEKLYAGEGISAYKYLVHILWNRVMVDERIAQVCK